MLISSIPTKDSMNCKMLTRMKSQGQENVMCQETLGKWTLINKALQMTHFKISISSHIFLQMFKTSKELKMRDIQTKKLVSFEKFQTSGPITIDNYGSLENNYLLGMKEATHKI